MKKFQRIAVILSLALILVACSGGSPESNAETATKADTAADTGAYPKMGVAELDDFIATNKGTPTMVAFWTTWCPSCKKEIPELEKLHKNYGDKLNILAISLDEKVEALDAFFAGGKPDLPVYFGDEAIARKFGVEAIPTLALFNKNGELTFAKPGAFPYAMLQAMADSLIKE